MTNKTKVNKSKERKSKMASDADRLELIRPTQNMKTSEYVVPIIIKDFMMIA